MMVGHSLDLDLDIVEIVGIGNRSTLLLRKERPVVDRDIVLAGHTIRSRCLVVVQILKQVVDLF